VKPSFGDKVLLRFMAWPKGIGEEEWCTMENQLVTVVFGKPAC